MPSHYKLYYYGYHFLLKSGAAIAKVFLIITSFISILFGCQNPKGLLTGFDFPDRPDGLLAGSWQDFNFPDRLDRPGRLLTGS